ncbi:MAG: hypothetical protein WKF73_18755 [Nocardioidaceae bacterium]
MSSTRAATGARSRACTGSPGLAGQSRERRAQATHPPRVRPELVAHGPSEVWTWDITALKGPGKENGTNCMWCSTSSPAYVAGWLVANAEDAVVAKDFLADAVARNHGRAADDPRRPGRFDDLETGVRTDDRPRRLPLALAASDASNDNPYSEAQFKTLKYVPDFPERFGSLADARAFCDRVLRQLQPRAPPLRDRHAHPGVGPLRTPHPRSSERRQVTLDRAHAQHPERFSRRLSPPRLPEQAWINEPIPQQPTQ